LRNIIIPCAQRGVVVHKSSRPHARTLGYHTRRLVGPWCYVIVRVDFSAECVGDGLVIVTVVTRATRLRTDEVQLGPADTTQARRLQMKVINKAIHTAYVCVFHVRRRGDMRISHVTWDKIPNKQCDMFHNLFAWYGYRNTYQCISCHLP
jgi:hypothetical protein